MAVVNAGRSLRAWFQQDANNRLYLHYCPSHSGIEENEAVDADVKFTARDRNAARRPAREPDPTFYSFIKHAITRDIREEWSEMAWANPRKYWGRYYLRHPAFCTLRHTGSFVLKRLGGRPNLVARFVRCITNHAPTGHYRDRFRARYQENTWCVLHDGPPRYHTREHVLFHCDYYVRRYRHSSIEELLQSLDPFYDILTFLDDNPTALSFEDLPDWA
ncbi:hypothetical protein BV20DRAFT_1038955 [Pilatotrama ljubarskyi]|nr:hypothetical protein BV20DRAFT_1038955 [Pilatotrama ljubarskyi]